MVDGEDSEVCVTATCTPYSVCCTVCKMEGAGSFCDCLWCDHPPVQSERYYRSAATRIYNYESNINLIFIQDPTQVSLRTALDNFMWIIQVQCESPQSRRNDTVYLFPV